MGLTKGKTWDDVRRELSDEQVKRIHDAFSSLWPEDTDLIELLPRPREDTFRAVYLGVSDPRTVETTILGCLPYFDEVVLAHPFLNASNKAEFSPTRSPSQHKTQTLKNVLLLLILEPYIGSGYVHLIPDPGDFNPQFGMSAIQMARERAADWKPGPQSRNPLNALAKDDHHRYLCQLPEGSLGRFFRSHAPEPSDAEIESAIGDMKWERASDPNALLQPVEPGDAGAQFLYIKGYGLEAAMYLATLTGSSIYTEASYWQQLHMHAMQADPMADSVWIPVVEALRAVDFPIDMSAPTLLEVRRAGRFGGMRAAMRRFAEAVRQPAGPPRPDQIALQFTKAAQALNGEWADVPRALPLIGNAELSAPTGGFERNDVRRLLLTFGRAKSVHPIPFAMLIKL